jgi:dethiobiotin synthetase
MPATTHGLFITSIGTGAGKTFVCRALAAAARSTGRRVAAVKPLETGCQPEAKDAIALALAAGDPDLAFSPAYYRSPLPLAPLAATLESSQPGPDIDLLVTHLLDQSVAYEVFLVEGAGGLLVPLDSEHYVADLVRRLGYPIVLVAENRLGVISYVLTAAECARTRGIELAATVLTQLSPQLADSSCATNTRILSAKLGRPVIQFPFAADDDALLAGAARSCGLIGTLGRLLGDPI